VVSGTLGYRSLPKLLDFPPGAHHRSSLNDPFRVVRSIVSRLWHGPLLGSRLKTDHLQKEKKMGNKLYVGNLSYNTTEADLRDLFTEQGHQTVEVKVVLDRDTGRPRGFAFVEMSSGQDVQKAISSLNGKELQGRALSVSEARERTGGGGGGGGFGGGRGQRW
jgi:cold-inducible RNA-binding protein